MTPIQLFYSGCWAEPLPLALGLQQQVSAGIARGVLVGLFEQRWLELVDDGVEMCCCLLGLVVIPGLLPHKIFDIYIG